jgi:hypothetical protein
MQVVIYRNIKGDFQYEAFEWWKSFVKQLGFLIDEHNTKNTSTITVYQDETAATFTIFYSESGPHLCLNYLRLKPANPHLVKLIDSLIQNLNLSGEKHMIHESDRTFTIFQEGKVVKTDHRNKSSTFELLLIKETIFGHVHLSLDRMIEFQRLGHLDKVAEIKETFEDYRRWLNQLTAQINNSK